MTSPEDGGTPSLLIVTASGSVYMRQGTQVTRIPRRGRNLAPHVDPSVDLRRDGEPLTVLSMSEPVVGERWELLLQVREDGVRTVRSTTPVVRIERLDASGRAPSQEPNVTGSERDQSRRMDSSPAQRQLLLDLLLPRLGAKLLAYTLGRGTTAALREPPSSTLLQEDLARLRLLSAVLDRLGEPDDVAAAWLLGLNQDRGDVSPLRVLHEQGGAAGPALLAAASAHHR